MKTALMVTLFSLVSVSAKADCKDVYDLDRTEFYFDRISRGAQNAIVTSTAFGGLILGATIATDALGAFAIAAPIASAPVWTGEAIKGVLNAPFDRMIRLIEQSERVVATGTDKKIGLLKRLHRQVEKEFTREELAQAIVQANNNYQLCKHFLVPQFYSDLKSAAKSGQLRTLLLTGESSSR